MNFVLVHGAWCGGWWMSRLARALRGRGAEVFAPTLTGLGEREHLASPEVGLDTHIRDITALLHYEDLRDVVLVGHSYGGAVVTGAADRARDRIKRLIYFDGFVLRNGQSLADLFPPEMTQAFSDLARREGDGWRMPSPFTMEQFGVTIPEDIAWNRRGMTMQPLKTLLEPLTLQSGPFPFPVSYVYCKVRAMGLFDQFAARAKSEGWDYREVPLTHAAPAVAPEATADLLMEIAGIDAARTAIRAS
jgi:pimeloyl-ACP methyl ester carboxylesterase